MKLYLTQILKEANQAGFAQDTAFNNPTIKGPTVNPQPQIQAPIPQPQAGGMMLPGTQNLNNIQLPLTPAKFTPTI